MKINYTVVLIFLTSTAAAASSEWPKPSQTNCEFYQKLEEQLHCKDAGVDYLSHYAPFYCEAFRTKSESWKPEMKVWSGKTGACLQEMLYEHRSNPKLSCKTLESIAFKTHAICYNAADLCQKGLGDIIEVLKVIKFKDFIKEFRYSHKEMIKLGKTCISRWISQ